MVQHSTKKQKWTLLLGTKEKLKHFIKMLKDVGMVVLNIKGTRL